MALIYGTLLIKMTDTSILQCSRRFLLLFQQTQNLIHLTEYISNYTHARYVRSEGPKEVAIKFIVF